MDAMEYKIMVGGVAGPFPLPNNPATGGKQTNAKTLARGWELLTNTCKCRPKINGYK